MATLANRNICEYKRKPQVSSPTVSHQVIPLMEEQEMTKIFIQTLGSFYCERMVASAPSDFTEMVGMGVRLEEAVREGRLRRDESSSCAKKTSYGFSRKKEGDANVVVQERRAKPPRRRHVHQQQVASVTPVVNIASTSVAYKRTPQQGNQGQSQKREPFDPIPMS